MGSPDPEHITILSIPGIFMTAHKLICIGACPIAEPGDGTAENICLFST